MVLFFEALHERRVGIAFPHQQVQGGSFLGAGTEQEDGEQAVKAKCDAPNHHFTSAAAAVAGHAGDW